MNKLPKVQPAGQKKIKKKLDKALLVMYIIREMDVKPGLGTNPAPMGHLSPKIGWPEKPRPILGLSCFTPPPTGYRISIN
jgi:hypothetical protein